MRRHKIVEEMRERVQSIRRLRTPEDSTMRKNFVSYLLKKDSDVDEQKQFIINHNTLPSLLTLLLSPKKSIRKEACWAISNITAGNEEQIHAVIEANIIPSLMQLWANSESLDVREETARAISSATSGGNAEQIKFSARTLDFIF